MPPLSERNTRMDGVMMHAITPDDAERREQIRTHNERYHEFGFGTRWEIIKFDPGAVAGDWGQRR